MNPLDEVMTAAEAAEKWGMNPRSIQQACTGYKGGKPRFTPDEARKAGRIWLVTRAGMERLYGPEP
ncbi:MAG: helix-turn-helix domain-containing protein [Megasphaera massiliensis]|uniref:helix-turn-helix domain-containing protein n=1 Tax=Megasphaera massiliensis TaxID=1232428 RepID=UPI002A75F90B|nr:helix-turn-helix domain-containing protein [Megasphaera massiliensis]MDY2965181.1 helix-turn-helix domain-containing protein [Megasphaera massiliensis]